MRKVLFLAAIAGVATPSFAGIVFDNPANPNYGNCNYNTTCGGENINVPNDFAAALFTLGASTTLTSATVTNFT